MKRESHYLRFSTSCFLRGDDGAADKNLSASWPFPLQNTPTAFIRTHIQLYSQLLYNQTSITVKHSIKVITINVKISRYNYVEPIHWVNCYHLLLLSLFFHDFFCPAIKPFMLYILFIYQYSLINASFYVFSENLHTFGYIMRYPGKTGFKRHFLDTSPRILKLIEWLICTIMRICSIYLRIH